MAELTDIIKKLEDHVEDIISYNNSLKTTVSELSKERNELLKLVEKQQNQIRDINEKNKMLKLAKSINSSDEKSTDIKLKINELVREIDKCISLLNG